MKGRATPVCMHPLQRCVQFQLINESLDLGLHRVSEDLHTHMHTRESGCDGRFLPRSVPGFLPSSLSQVSHYFLIGDTLSLEWCAAVRPRRSDTAAARIPCS